jgi:hypothetical protein
MVVAVAEEMRQEVILELVELLVVVVQHQAQMLA